MIIPERVCVCCVWCSGEALAYKIGHFLLPPAGWCCGPRGQLACSWQHAQQMATAEAMAPPAAVEAPAAPAVEAPAVERPAAPAVERPAAPAVERPAAPAVEAPAVQVPMVAAVQMPIELLDKSGKVIAVSTNGTSYGQEEVKA